MSLMSELGAGVNRSQIFECPKLVGDVGGFQTTLAQLASMCKGHCMCFPFHDLVVSFHKEGVSVAEPLYVSLDPPILKLPSSLCKVVVHRGWTQENGFKPRWEWLNWFSQSHRLGVNFEDVGRGPWTIVVSEPSDCPFVEKLDPLDRAVWPKGDVDLEPRIASVDFIPLGASLERLFVFLELFFKVFDTFSSGCSLTVEVVLPCSDRDTQ